MITTLAWALVGLLSGGMVGVVLGFLLGAAAAGSMTKETEK